MRTLLAIAYLLGAALTGLGAEPPKILAASKTRHPNTPVNIQVTAHFEMREQALHVSYTLLNQEGRPVYVMDVFLETSRAGNSLKKDFLFVKQDELPRLVFQATLPVIPPGVSMLTPPTAYGSLVKPGETYKGEFVLKLPIVIKKTNAVTALRAALEIGVVPDIESLAATKDKVGGKEVFLLNYQAWAKQKVVRSAEQEISIPIKVAD